MERKSLLLLGGRSRRVLLEMIYSIIVYMLSVLDATEPADGKELDAAAPRGAQQACRLRDQVGHGRSSPVSTVSSTRRPSGHPCATTCSGIPIGMFACGLLIYFADGWTHALAGKGQLSTWPTRLGSASPAAPWVASSA